MKTKRKTLSSAKTLQATLNEMLHRIGETISPYKKTPINTHKGGSCAVYK